uniref:Uncharacterized protein n=1 Tax=Magnusiomyces tetraspermus TaxID=1232584 RepID=A0A023UNI0_9ASCO|nr:hypothetical protein [Magnusiomyces tetraspermus]AHY04933.1 hypothetical protein [Magnusiomyces tetraspermus]
MAYCIPRTPIDTERSSGPIMFYKQNSATPIDRAFTTPTPVEDLTQTSSTTWISTLNFKHCRSWATPIPTCLRRRAMPARIFTYTTCPTSLALDTWGTFRKSP